MQARQMETTSLSGAIDEIEARQLDSLAQQATGRTHYSWVLPFADQYPVYIEFEHQKVAGSEEGNAQSVWSVDLEVGLTASVAMAANVRVDQDGGLGLRLWLPDPNFYRLAQASRGQLEEMIAGRGLSLIGLTVYPVARDAGTVDDSRPRMECLLMPNVKHLLVGPWQTIFLNPKTCRTMAPEKQSRCYLTKFERRYWWPRVRANLQKKSLR